MPLPIISRYIKLYINIYHVWWELHFTFLRPLFLILNIATLIRFSPNVVFCDRWEGPHAVKTILVINTDIYICIGYNRRTGSLRSSEAVVYGCSSKKVLLIILQYSQELPALESLFNKVAGLQACNLIK